MVVLSVPTLIVSILLERYAIGLDKIDEKFLDKSEYVCSANEIFINISHQSIIYPIGHEYCVNSCAIFPNLITKRSEWKGAMQWPLSRASAGNVR